MPADNRATPSMALLLVPVARSARRSRAVLPMVTLLARTDFFGHGHKLSGLDPEHLGVERLPGQMKPSRPAKPSTRKPVGGEV